jgi:hypothetical protein
MGTCTGTTRARYTLPIDPAATSRAQTEIELLRRAVKADLRMLAMELDADREARIRVYKLAPLGHINPEKMERITAVNGQQWA